METDRKIWEKVANQCAPVLMDVKPSNLLILTRAEEERYLELEGIPGISSLCLHAGAQKSTWLLYREDRMEAVLIWPQTQAFLAQYGYHVQGESLERLLERMVARYTLYREKRAGFPHELGIFLGYPLGDVEGFIRHQGRNYLCAGYWKVYQNERRARETFQLYRTVKDTMQKMLSAGESLHEICSFVY